MAIIRHFYSKAKEELQDSVILFFTFMMLLSLKTLLFNQIPKMINDYNLIILSKMVCNVMFAISCVLILGRKRAGVWLWLVVIAAICVVVFVDKGFPGFTTGFVVRVFFLLLMLVFCLSIKKNGKTAWSVLK